MNNCKIAFMGVVVGLVMAAIMVYESYKGKALTADQICLETKCPTGSTRTYVFSRTPSCYCIVPEISHD